jgi:ATP-dependent DNA ligase
MSARDAWAAQSWEHQTDQYSAPVDLSPAPETERERPRFSECQQECGERYLQSAVQALGGVISATQRARRKVALLLSLAADRSYAPGDRGIWVKSKCLNREEFVVVGWTDPEGSRSHIGALLLGYYTEDGKLHYAGRAGTGMTAKEVKRLAGVLAPLQVLKMPLAEPPQRDSRFGSPLKLPRCTG